MQDFFATSVQVQVQEKLRKSLEISIGCRKCRKYSFPVGRKQFRPHVLHFGTSLDKCLTGLVTLVLLEVLDEAGSEVLSLLFPLVAVLVASV